MRAEHHRTENKKKLKRSIQCIYYINEQIDENLNDSQKLWRNIHKLSSLGKDKSETGLKELKNESGDLVTGQDAADYMNKFYIEAGPKLADVFPNN